MPTNRLPKKGLVDSLIFLNEQFKRIQRELCCGGGTGGLTQVYTQDSATVTWSGNGTQSDPLIATAVGGGGGVTSFNTRTGAVTLTSEDVNTALGYTAYNGTTNPSGFLTSVPAQTWTSITGKPTTVSGYGITDILTQVLTGYVTGANSTILATDTILGAFQKAQGQLNSKAPIASPTFTGTVSGITKVMVGLGNVDNTSDITKFTNTSLTGVPTAPTAGAGTNTTQIATTAFVQAALPQTIVAGTLPSDLTPYPDGSLFIIG